MFDTITNDQMWTIIGALFCLLVVYVHWKGSPRKRRVMGCCNQDYDRRLHCFDHCTDLNPLCPWDGDGNLPCNGSDGANS